MKKSFTSMPSRRDREREAHRVEILEAAERIFAQKGYEASTVEEIAREAEFAIGTLYKFFDTKESLFLAVADRILDELVLRFEEDIRPVRSDVRVAVPRFLALRLQEISTHEAFMHVFHPVFKARCHAAWTSAAPDERMKKFLDYRTQAVSLFEEGIRQGILHAVPAEDMLIIVEGAIRFFVKLWSRPGTDLSPEEKLQILSRSLLSLLWAHPPSKGSART